MIVPHYAGGAQTQIRIGLCMRHYMAGSKSHYETIETTLIRDID